MTATLATLPRNSPRETIAAATPPSRNRAIDAYRAVAMVAVALGHWLASDARTVQGRIEAGNALDRAPQLHALTWVFQVMPLFFCIGGYANAASLDAHRRSGHDDNVWVQARLLRLSTPSSWLAGTWLSVVIIANLLGFGALARTALAVAAIPLWFLANYVIDTALAPRTLSLYRRHRMGFVGVLLVVFLVAEAARFPGIPFVPQINIIIGWLLFQVLGFAWKDGRLPSPSRLLKVGATSWAVAGSLVAFGPWPLAMVSVPGARFANTWPPSLALLAYGLGACSFAIAAAPTLDRLLRRRSGLWTAVVAANAMAMTSYLWHFTALALAVFGLSQIDMLPTAAIGSSAWWLQKLPVMGAALAILVVLVVVFAPKERDALLANRTTTEAPPNAAGPSTIILALVLAVSFEMWTVSRGNLFLATLGMAGVLLVHRTLHSRSLAGRWFQLSKNG